MLVRDPTRLFLLAILVTSALCVHAAPLPPIEAGSVRFYNIADSDFDVYSRKPAPAMQRWMRAHYARMQTYEPYFDSRLSWYPDAWVYKDSYAIKPHWPEYAEHPEWVLRDAQGNELFIPWGCANGRCPQFAGDVGNPAFRAHWIESAKAHIARGYRGLWIDDVNLTWRVSDGEGRFVQPIDPRTGKPMRLEDWRRNFAVFMEEIRTALPDIEIAHNSIWYAAPAGNVLVERQISAADYINLERGATDPGLTGGGGRWSFARWLAFIDSIHAQNKGVILMEYSRSTPQREFGLATWLLISSGIDMLSSDELSWTAPDSFWAGYTLRLGSALGSRRRWRGLYLREFECGYSLVNPPEARPVAVAFPPGLRRLEGTEAGTITLAGGTGAVLLRDCASLQQAGTHADQTSAQLAQP